MLLLPLATFALRATIVLCAALALRVLLGSRMKASARYRLVFYAVLVVPALLVHSILGSVSKSGAAIDGPSAEYAADLPEDEVLNFAAGGKSGSRPEIPESAADALVGVWGAGCLILIGRSAAARISAARRLQKFRPCSDPRWLRALSCARDRLAVRRPVALLDGGGLPPFAADFSGGAVVVPSDGEWSPGDRVGILLHELSHLKRGDLRRMAWMEAVAATLWFLPFAWLALKALEEDREEDCDSLVVGNGVVPADYAALLLEFSIRRPLPPARARAMANPARIERRILAILAGSRRSAPNSVAGGAAGIALAAAILCSGWIAGAAPLFAVEAAGTVVLPAIAHGEFVSVRLARSDLPFGAPVAGAAWRASQRFGPHEHPVSGTPYLHSGIDLTEGRSGGVVRSTLAGTVADAGYDSGLGNYVVVERGRSAVVFAKLQRILVERGDAVAVGTEIGTVGNTGISTGPHLHYEVRVDGVAVDPEPLLALGASPFSGL